MIEQDINGIKALIKDQRNENSYWLVDICNNHVALVNQQEAAQTFSMGPHLLFLSDAKTILTHLAIKPKADLNIACLKTIKGLISKNNQTSLNMPPFADGGQARTWVINAIEHAQTKIASLGMAALVNLECKTILATLAMEQTGLPFNKSRWQNTLTTIEREAQRLQKLLQSKLHTQNGFELFGPTPLDLNSPQAVKSALEKTLGHEIDGTSQSSLAHIKHEAVDILLRLREYERLLNTYGVTFLNKVQNNRLRGIFEPLGTSSGRFSCHSPNLQALPGNPLFRACIDPGAAQTLLGFDYGGFELRILAALSLDEALLAIFNDNLDIHSMVATAVFKVDVSKTLNAHLRDQAKVLNFGIIYGMGEHALSHKLNVSIDQAKELLANYFKRFRRVKEFLHDLQVFATANSYCKTALGRRAYFLEDMTVEHKHKMRIARNMPIQGTGADILKLAMCKVFKALSEDSLDAHLVNSIHDELVVQCAKDQEVLVSALVTNCMKDAFSALLPNIAPDVSATPFT